MAALAPFSSVLSPWVSDTFNSFTQNQPDTSSPYGQASGFNTFANQSQPETSSFFDNNFTKDTSQGYGDYGNSYTGMSQQESERGTYSGLGGSGKTSQAGGNWSALDRFNGEFEQAASQYGAPVNLIKSMINRESSGNWERDNRIAIIRDANGNITRTKADGTPDHMLPFSGIFESTASSWGLDWNSLVGNRQAQIDGMAKIMSGLSQQYGGYENAAKVYFGGPQALNGGFTDEFKMDSNTYGNTAVKDWKYLDSLAGNPANPGYGSAASYDSVVPGGAVYDWGEFGGQSNNGLYGYGTQYGLSGTQHTGADIVGKRGTVYTAPMGGQVMCAGTGIGQATDGSACAAFNDTGGGAGRVEVQLDNGAVLIYGHSSASALQPGQRFNAGDALGQIGTMNSDHVHLEARVRDPSTPSGWRIVDPRTVIGGGGMPTGSYNQPQKPSFSGLWAKYLGK